jgi:hypothetical protein
MKKTPYQIFLGNPEYRQLGRDYLFSKLVKNRGFISIWNNRNQFHYGPRSDTDFINASFLDSYSGKRLFEKNRYYFGLMSKTMGGLWKELPHLRRIPFYASSRISRFSISRFGRDRIRYFNLNLSERENIGFLIGINGCHFKRLAKRIRDWTGDWPFIIYHRDRTGQRKLIIETLYYQTGVLTLRELSRKIQFHSQFKSVS